MAHLKLYYFSRTKLDFVEARGARIKISLIAITSTLVLGLFFFSLNESYGDFLGLGLQRMSSLYSENALLKNQLRSMAQRLGVLEKQLTALNDRGNELRLLVDLPRIDEDTRHAGVGGTDERTFFGGSTDIDDQLQELNAALGRTGRELRLQQSSFSEVNKMYEDNQVRFAHLPALKPMDGFYSSRFGMRLHPIFGVMKPHEGIDIVNDKGTSIYAAADGIVVSAGHNLGGYGNMVMINHGYGYSTVYGHMSKVIARDGQQVRRGDLLGLCGETGIATNPHLHYEVRLNGVSQNPRDFFFDDINVADIRSEQYGGKQ